MHNFFKKLFNRKKLVLKKYLNFSKAQKILTKPARETKGSVLIEFVACVPLLIILLLYIVDIIKISRLSSQTEFVAYETANVLQNISSDITLAEDEPRIKKPELINAFCISWLHLYPGTSIYYNPDIHAHLPMTIIWYITGNEDGSASCEWGAIISTIESQGTSPEQVSVRTIDSQYPGSAITWGENVEPSSIYPNLQILPGGEKVLVETILVYQPSDNDSPRDAFGLFGTLPRHKEEADYHYFLNSVISFSPKPQLFNEFSKLYIDEEVVPVTP